MAYVAIPPVTGGGGGGTITTSAPLSGDGSAGTPATIAAGAIGLTLLATQAAQTVLGNGTAGAASPVALDISGATSGLVATATVLNNTLTNGKSGGQTVIGSTVTAENILIRPNSANATTGQVQFIGVPGATTAYLVNSGAQSITQLVMGGASAGLNSAFVDVQCTKNTAMLVFNGIGQSAGAAATLGWQLGMTSTAFMTTSLAGSGFTTAGNMVANSYLESLTGSGNRVIRVSTGRLNVEVPFVGFSGTSVTRAQAAGQVMAFATTPPSQVAAAGSVLDAYKWDAVTATFTTAVNITTAAGLNFATFEAPTYTNASACAVTVAATATIKAAPIAAGSLTITEPLAFWVQAGTTRLDGDLKLAQTTAAAAQALTLLNGPTATAGGDPDIYFTVKSGANTYVVPGWQI